MAQMISKGPWPQLQNGRKIPGISSGSAPFAKIKLSKQIFTYQGRSYICPRTCKLKKSHLSGVKWDKNDSWVYAVVKNISSSNWKRFTTSVYFDCQIIVNTGSVWVDC